MTDQHEGGDKSMRVAIVDCGRISRAHMSALKEIGRLETVPVWRQTTLAGLSTTRPTCVTLSR